MSAETPSRIVFLSVSAEMGGSEVSLLTLVRGLRREVPAWPLDVVLPRAGPLSRAVDGLGARAHVLPFPDALSRVGEASSHNAASMVGRGASLLLAAGGVARYGRELSRLLASLAPDVVHSNGFKMHVLGARSKPSSSALLWHVHEYIAHRPISRRLLRRYAGRCDAIVANSRSVAAEVTRTLEAGARVSAIYNAVELTEFSPVGEAADLDRLAGLAPAPPGTVRVGLVATYGRWKGHSTFIAAMRQLAAVAPVRGYIVGGALYDTAGSQYSREELESAVAAAGMTAHIGLTGFVERPATAFRALDVVVHASTQPEPFGLVIAEGLAAGRAVIVSDAGGAAELVSNEVNALTHAPGNVEALAGCIERLARDPALRARLGAAGRETAVRLFAPDTFTRRFVDVYREARASVAAHAGC